MGGVVSILKEEAIQLRGVYQRERGDFFVKMNGCFYRWGLGEKTLKLFVELREWSGDYHNYGMLKLTNCLGTFMIIIMLHFFALILKTIDEVKNNYLPFELNWVKRQNGLYLIAFRSYFE